MSETKVAIKLTTLDDICDAVREAENTTELIPIEELKPRILALGASGEENKLNQYFNKTLKEVTAADLSGTTSIPERAFYTFKSLESVTMSDTITEMGANAFDGCSAMKSIKLSNGITVLNHRVLAYCTALESLTLPSNLTTINNSAITWCSALSEITIPISLKTAIGYAFQNCNSLKKVYYEGSVKDWCEIAFDNANGNPLVNVADFYYKNSAGEYECLIDFVVPNTITEITQYAFYGCSSIISLTVPNTVESVGKMAFASCTNLTSIIIDAAHIGQQCFVYSDNVSTVIVGSNVAQIDSGAFQCGSSSTSKRPTFTFLGTTPPTISTNTFSTKYLKKIIVPKGCGETYKAATNWANYADYIEEAAE